MTTYKSIKYNFTASELDNLTQSPTITGISPSSYTEAQLPANITIAGTNFVSGLGISFVGADGTAIASDQVTINSGTQITARVPATVGGQNNDPYDIKITGVGSSQLDNSFSIDDNPVFATAAGSLGAITDESRSSYTLSPATATDPEGVSVTYAIQSGSLPGGLSLNSSTGAITGTANAVGSSTTSTFTIRATAGSQTSDRQFTIIVLPPTTTAFTSMGSGSYTPPFTGTMKVLVVAGGGGGDGGSNGGHTGGGGAGGLVYHPTYSVTKDQAIPYYVGNGNPQSGGGNITGTGQNSQFGQNDGAATTTASVLTALGGGSSGTGDGGSGGGRSHSSGAGGLGIQTNSNTISADSKSKGFGNNGGTATGSGGSHPSGGGGGAGAVGQNASGGNQAGNGGAGKDMSAQFGTSHGVSGSFAGGGGGGTHQAGHAGGSGGSGGGAGTTTGNSSIGSNGTANTGGGAGTDAKGGSGVIIIKF